MHTSLARAHIFDKLNSPATDTGINRRFRCKSVGSNPIASSTRCRVSSALPTEPPIRPKPNDTNTHIG